MENKYAHPRACVCAYTCTCTCTTELSVLLFSFLFFLSFRAALAVVTPHAVRIAAQDFCSVAGLFKGSEVSYLRYYRVNLVNPQRYTWGNNLLFGDETFSSLADAVAPGVVVVAVVVPPGKKVYGSYVDTDSVHDDDLALAYYDVEAEKLYVGASADALGIHDTYLNEFSERGDGRDDCARVLRIPLDEWSDIFDSFPGNDSEFRGLHRRMFQLYETQSPGERAHNIQVWAALVDARFSLSDKIGDDDVEELEKELKALEGIEALWPEAFAVAYSSFSVKAGGGRVSIFRHFPAYDTRDPLRAFHLSRVAPFLNAEDKELVMTTQHLDKVDETTAVACAELRAIITWPVSARCTFIVACLQLGFMAAESRREDEDEDEAATACQKRKHFA